MAGWFPRDGQEDSHSLMQNKLIARNKKCEVTLQDNVVVKRFLQHFSPLDTVNYEGKDAKCRARWEQDALLVLQTKFGVNTYQGWLYKTVELLGVGIDRESLYLEYAKGQTIAEMNKEDMLLAEYHAGVWLALYHQKMNIAKDQAMLYTDYTVYNILVDFENRTLVCIDPGYFWGRHGFYYEEVIHHIHGILALSFRKKRVPLRAVHQFLKGYAALNPFPGVGCYYTLLIREFKRLDWELGLRGETPDRGSWIFVSKRRWLFRMLSIILIPFYFAYLPVYLSWRFPGIRVKPSE